MVIQSRAIRMLVVLSIAVWAADASAGVIITPVFPTTQGQVVNLDAAYGGFVKIGSNASSPDDQVNTTDGKISAITHVGSFSSTQEVANSAPYFQFESASPAINDNFGANTSFGPQDNSGNGFTFTVANAAVAQTLNVYVGEFNAISSLTVTPTNGGAMSLSQTGNSNTYLDMVVSLPANSGLTTINWVETQQNGGANNPSIFAVTTSAPEPGTCLLLGLAVLGLAAAIRQARRV
jgi:MYXO-CTERM domain-containing protein